MEITPSEEGPPLSEGEDVFGGIDHVIDHGGYEEEEEDPELWTMEELAETMRMTMNGQILCDGVGGRLVGRYNIFPLVQMINRQSISCRCYGEGHRSCAFTRRRVLWSDKHIKLWLAMGMGATPVCKNTAEHIAMRDELEAELLGDKNNIQQ